MTPGRWELVRGMAYPTMALVIGGSWHQRVSLRPSGLWVVANDEDMEYRRARPGEVPVTVRDALMAEQTRRSA